MDRPNAVKTTLAKTAELATMRAQQDLTVTRANGYVLIERPDQGVIHFPTNNPAGVKLADIPGFVTMQGDRIIARMAYQQGQWQDVGDSIDSGLLERSAGDKGKMPP